MLASQCNFIRLQKATFRTSVPLNAEAQPKFKDNEKDLENFEMLLNKISPDVEDDKILPSLVQ